MANLVKALNEHFMYNHRVSKALLQLLSSNEKQIIQLWLDKLMDMDKSAEQMIIRNDYMWFVLMMLQSKKIKEPFTTFPPVSLPSLKQFVPIHVYEEVLISNEPNMVHHNYSTDSILAGKPKTSTAVSCPPPEPTSQCYDL